MSPHPFTPRQALNKAYLKLKPTRIQIDHFKHHLKALMNQIDDAESEEFHKILVIDFLKKTYYAPQHFINTKGRSDLVIHNGDKANSTVGVIIEAKKPANKSEMVTPDSLNAKAFHELMLYYLRERITGKNLEIRHLIITNIYEWFIFDAHEFERHFAHDKTLAKQFTEFEAGRLGGKTTDFFYKEIAAPFLEKLTEPLTFTHFDLRDYEPPLKSPDKASDRQLIALFKVFSPEHLLKLPFANDSNTLDKPFYYELLHIIGLEEVSEKGKNLIQRQAKGQRNAGSLLENAITILDDGDRLYHFERASEFGETISEQQYNVALELCITWVNRILFLKLLESQLIAYHKGDANYAFLNEKTLPNHNALNTLFFSVLAKESHERSGYIKEKFAHIPYLNSSLFEPTDLERKVLEINQLNENIPLAIWDKTVLKNTEGKTIQGQRSTLVYLFGFLDAYDFSSQGTEDIQEENKTLINAAVLGLIFEKINGYKEGSFFTPGFITMYMCRETIRRAVVQKFNEEKGWNCQNLDDLYNKIDDLKEANAIVNRLKICDPSVGSGHFLVSALNEIIAVKQDLKILQDRDGRRLKEYHIEVVNDELVVNEDNELFQYHVHNKEKQRLQEALFHEKQTLIENCLFGVDINPNSVKICRLRLWIELLKNAYYKSETELETLPNIDINIKCGNSLVSRFALTDDLRKALRQSKWNIESYRLAVQRYHHATDRREKYQITQLIDDIKTNFQAEIRRHHPLQKKLDKLGAELYQLTGRSQNGGNGRVMFETDGHNGKAEKEKQRKQRVAQLEKEIEAATEQLEEEKNNKIYQNAFEWRFEFPEALNDEGDFIGFDVVVSNPPYGVSVKENYREAVLKSLGKVPDYEIYYYFIEKAHTLVKQKGILSYITPNTYLFNTFAASYRISLLNKWEMLEILDCTKFSVFEAATVRNTVNTWQKGKSSSVSYRITESEDNFKELTNKERISLSVDDLLKMNQNWSLAFMLDAKTIEVISSIKNDTIPVSEIFPDISQGLIAYDKYRGQSEEIIENRAYHYDSLEKSNLKKWLKGADITRYSVNWNGQEYIDYCDGIANPRNPKFFRGERLLIREITDPSIYAGVTDEELYNDPSIIIVKSNKDLSVKILSGILNSKLASFYHFNYSPKATKGAFPKILVKDIKNFPIPVITSENQIKVSKIESLVTQILALKKADPAANTSKLEKEIDRLVYGLYGLSKKEIKIIEGSGK